MGEIKSTLDLVMERTRHLSLTDEEKKCQRTANYAKRLQGLLQQYEDGALCLEDLHNRAAVLQAELQIEARPMVVDGVMRRIDPDGDNTLWLALLDEVAPDIGKPLLSILEGHRLKQAEILAAGKLDQFDRLASRHGISGSAVLPNPQQDPTCRQHLSDLKQATQTRITALLRQAAA